MLRLAAVHDAPQIARLHIASWRATYTHELPSDFLATWDAAAHAAHWRAEFQHGVTVLLEESDSELRGFAACGPVRNPAISGQRVWEIYNLHVAPAMRGQGIGTALFDEAIRLGHAQDARDLVLWVVESNCNARRFYERKGMKHDGGRQEHRVGEEYSLQEVHYSMRLCDRGL